jgi:hypothetical protein
MDRATTPAAVRRKGVIEQRLRTVIAARPRRQRPRRRNIASTWLRGGHGEWEWCWCASWSPESPAGA